MVAWARAACCSSLWMDKEGDAELHLTLAGWGRGGEVQQHLQSTERVCRPNISPGAAARLLSLCWDRLSVLSSDLQGCHHISETRRRL